LAASGAACAPVTPPTGSPMTTRAKPLFRAMLKLVEVIPERPPKSRYFFDVELHNDSDAPAWILLPRVLDRSGLPTSGGVEAVEPVERLSEGRVVIGQFLGTGGFAAIKLPARAYVIVRRLPISSWSDPRADTLTLEIARASHVTIGTEPIEAWFASDPTSDANVVVDASLVKALPSRRTPDHEELPVTAQDVERLRVTLALLR